MKFIIVVTHICASWWCPPPTSAWKYVKPVEAQSYEHCIELAKDYAWKQSFLPDKYTVNCRPVGDYKIK